MSRSIPLAAIAGIFIVVVLLSTTSGSSSVEERWATAAQGELFLRHGKQWVLVDLNSNELTRFQMPDSSILVNRLSKLYLPEFEFESGHAYFMSDAPIKGVWSFDPRLGEFSFVKRWRDDGCNYVDNTPDLDANGDTIKGSLTMIRRSDVSFKVCQGADELFILTEYKIEPYRHHCSCVDTIGSIADETLQEAERRLQVGSGSIWYEIKVLADGKMLGPIAQFESGGAADYAVSRTRPYAALVSQCCPRSIQIFDRLLGEV